METVIVYIQSLLASVVVVIPLGYAFGAGMMSTVNPCGFALLPAYLSLYLGANPQGEWDTGAVPRFFKAILVSLAVTLGFVLLFSIAGGILAAGGQLLTGVLPWAGLLIGVSMVLLGLWLLVGRKTLYSGFALRASSYVGSRIPTRDVRTSTLVGVPSFFMFGIAYGIASLSCTLPIFLIVVGSSLVASGFLEGFLQFISYALGMGLVLLMLTLSMAFFKGVVAGYMRKGIPYLQRLSAVFVVAAGGFIVYYWLTIGELGERIQSFL